MAVSTAREGAHATHTQSSREDPTIFGQQYPGVRRCPALPPAPAPQPPILWYSWCVSFRTHVSCFPSILQLEAPKQTS
jgi:hypothetical protein